MPEAKASEQIREERRERVRRAGEKDLYIAYPNTPNIKEERPLEKPTAPVVDSWLRENSGKLKISRGPKGRS